MSKYCFVIRAAILVVTGICVGVPTCSMSAEPPPAARDTPQGELHNVVAKVIYPNRVDPNGLRDLSIQAQLEPGPFTIPKGYVVTKLRYHFADPKTGFEHDKVTATTIYSVTERRYVKEAKNNHAEIQADRRTSTSRRRVTVFAEVRSRRKGSADPTDGMTSSTWIPTKLAPPQLLRDSSKSRPAMKHRTHRHVSTGQVSCVGQGNETRRRT